MLNEGKQLIRSCKLFKINNAWELVEKPPNANIVKNKWVFKIKRDQNGDIAQYRARLVAKRFTQRYGVDYCETLSPVIRFDNLRLLLAVRAANMRVITRFSGNFKDLRVKVYRRVKSGNFLNYLLAFMKVNN